MSLTVGTWNLAKRASAAVRLAALVVDHGVDLMLVQEATTLVDPPEGYSMLAKDYPKSDTKLVYRAGIAANLVEPCPLSRLGSYATVAEADLRTNEFLVASVHALTRPASDTELEGLEAEDVRRPGVDVPWVNDLAFGLLDPEVAGRRFIVGADLNTSRLFPGGEAFFTRAEEHGWIDIVSAFFGEQQPTFLNSRSLRHQLDYLFCDTETAKTLWDARVDTGVTDRFGDGSSDHAAVIASFDL